MSLYDDAVLVLKGYEDQEELRQVYYRLVKDQDAPARGRR